MSDKAWVPYFSELGRGIRGGAGRFEIQNLGALANFEITIGAVESIRG